MWDPPIRSDMAAKSILFTLTVTLTVITSGAHLSTSLFFFLLLLSLFAISSNTFCAPASYLRHPPLPALTSPHASILSGKGEPELPNHSGDHLSPSRHSGEVLCRRPPS